MTFRIEGVDAGKIKRQITQRLSLRAPQERSLDILMDIVERIDLSKDVDLEKAIEAISKTYPSVEDFERDFPSLCFALATGVGKTRLMGAFIAFLYLTGRSKNFFVLAPNTTIYDKLIDDISNTASSKYVFRGIAQFAQNPPIIVTGDTWKEGRGVQGSDLFDNAVINIFNVDKINKEKGQIKSFQETIGDSYFDYLAERTDLVMIMDEAHRYRAKAGMKAIAELKPVLGLELTATPMTVGAKSKSFKNVVYEYGLGNAMADGFVKEPAVATRSDFKKSDFNTEQLEQIMLEDGIHYHEHVKAELDLYARQSGEKRVHPFVLVVAQDTTHAADIKAKIESDEFFSGAYKGKVIEVHSNQKGEEKEEAIHELINLEHQSTTEIVIHVNKLKEGWDVTNLYTIIPLRASASDILTEQTLGRGLRLPYGHRTGVEAVDTLTVIAHNRFDDVIQKAREEDSVIQMKQYTIGDNGDVGNTPPVIVTSPSTYETALTGNTVKHISAGKDISQVSENEQEPFIFNTEQDQKAAAYAMQIIKQQERQYKGGVSDLKKPDVQKDITTKVQRAMQSDQANLEGIVEETNYEKLVALVSANLIENMIEIPEIVVIPSREVNFFFDDFDLTGLDAIRYQPLSDKILIRQLRNDSQKELARSMEGLREEIIENYIITHLIDYDQIDYESQSELLYKLAGQIIEHLRQYLPDEDAVENVALSRGKDLAKMIFQQMMQHYRETPTEYKAKLVRAFRTLEELSYGITSLDKQIHFKTAATPLSATKSYLFKGTNKSPYSFHKFQSDTERRFAVMIDSDREPTVLRWLKPGTNQFGIEYEAAKRYEPDFVVETETEKLIIEIKAHNQMDDATVLTKSRAACEWVKNANEFASSNNSKLWSYALISENDITESATLTGLLAANRMV